ncbi:MAG: hypothetical protein R3B90_05025 [Planctomycetaceae bacterium]
MLVPTDDGVEVFLIDPANGVPIPAASEAAADTPFITRPATLAEVKADDALFRQLDLPGNPYPHNSQQFNRVKVKLIGTSSHWSNRIAILDLVSDHRSARLYDGLGQNRLKSDSLLDRVSAAGATGGWGAGDIEVWDFPELETDRFEAAAELAESKAQVFATLLQRPEVNSDQVLSRQTLGAARRQQISGAWKSAMEGFRQIRIGHPYYKIDPLNDLCMESAIYWTAGCQFELGEFDSVRNTVIGSYPPTFLTPIPPIWADGMMRLAIDASAELGDYPAAIQISQQMSGDQPFGHVYMVRRWARLAGITLPGDANAPAGGDAPPANGATPPGDAADPAVPETSADK